MSDMGVRSRSFLNEDQTWIAPESAREIASGGLQRRGVTLDMDLFDRDVFADGYIPSGVWLELITATGLYGPAGAAGGEGLKGPLYASVRWASDAAAGSQFPAAMLPRGTVLVDRLPANNGLDTGNVGDVEARFDFIGEVPAPPGP